MRPKAILFMLLFALSVSGQTKVYFAHFKDKNESSFSLEKPEDFLSYRSIERRERFNIPMDSADLPNSTAYLSKINNAGVEKCISLKWLQGALIYASEETATSVKEFAFVDTLIFLNDLPQLTPKSVRREISNLKKQVFHDTQKQLSQLNLLSLHERGFRGDGIHVAVIDAGYLNLDEIGDFKRLQDNGQLLSIRDFVNPESDIFSEHMHGTLVFSALVASDDSINFGSSPDASFHLLRSEHYDAENPAEMYYWCAAAEYADSVGVDLISSSLGYSKFDTNTVVYSHADLDGKTSPCTRSAQMAAEKGMMVVVSAGNDGDKAWQKIIVPADARDVVAVGAVDINAQRAGFSAYGPTADKRVKPDVMALGKQTYVIKDDGTLGQVNGTSFACPVVAGMLACVMQALPDKSPKEIIDAMRVTATNSLTPDSVYGYGIPDAEAIISYLSDNTSITVPKIAQWQLKVNPVGNTFSLTNISQRLRYKIYDEMGVFRQQGTVELNEEVSISALEKGIYILYLSNDITSQQIKMIVE